MPRFFVQRSAVSNGTIRIVGEDAHHISRSLRMAVGDEITVCDMQKNEYSCVLEVFDGESVVARILSEHPSDTEPPFEATVYQALPKGDKLDSIIQKSVECGVSRIVPFESERCVVRMKPEAEGKKTERRLRIAAEAAKQSGRGCLPDVSETVRFEAMVASAKKADLAIFCYEGDNTVPLGTALTSAQVKERLRESKAPTISIVIGSEGGFSLSEVECARENGMLICGLGKRILRTETAAAFVLGCLVYEFELQGD